MDAVLVRSTARARELQEKRESERRHALLVLVLRHLSDQGYLRAVDQLSAESGVSLTRYDAADNISLLQILQDFEEAREHCYGNRPKLVKHMESEAQHAAPGSRPAPRQPSRHQNNLGTAICPASPVSGQLAAHYRREKASAQQQAAMQTQQESQQYSRSATNASNRQSSFKHEPPASPSSSSDTRSTYSSAAPCLEVSGQGCEGKPASSRGSQQRGSHGSSSGSKNDSDQDEDAWETRLLKPLPTSLLGELQQLGAAISQDIYQENPNVKWADIIGLPDAKRLLQEAVSLPMKYPQLFTGLLAPWRGVLLYGPPGTGKTLLAKAVATSCRTTFFNISASSIVSKWRGDSEKLVRVLFDLARYHAPATIFLDEVDSLMGARGAEGEHEASRRMKTELLIQLDGLTSHSSAAKSSCSDSSSPAGHHGGPQVFVLAASNLPWDLDQAMLRRLQKRILVPLPGPGARLAMLTTLLGDRLAPGVDLEGLVPATDGYSGSDMSLLAKEAAMRPLRRILAVMEPQIYSSSEVPDGGLLAFTQERKAQAESSSESASTLVKLGPVTIEDLKGALSVTKPSAQGHEQQYKEFSSRFGQSTNLADEPGTFC